MSSYERSGVVIDQCTECRGVFLDRGELERFIDLAAGEVAQARDPQWAAPAPDRAWRQQPPQQVGWQGGRQDSDDDSDSHRGGSYQGAPGSKPPKHKKRKSMLGEIFDL